MRGRAKTIECQAIRNFFVVHRPQTCIMTGFLKAVLFVLFAASQKSFPWKLNSNAVRCTIT